MLATLKGIVRNGRIVPERELTVPEGTQVQISFALPDVPEEMQREFAEWDRASDDAWRMIDEWETNER